MTQNGLKKHHLTNKIRYISADDHDYLREQTQYQINVEITKKQ